jgi:hypothetical protein
MSLELIGMIRWPDQSETGAGEGRLIPAPRSW